MRDQVLPKRNQSKCLCSNSPLKHSRYHINQRILLSPLQLNLLSSNNRPMWWHPPYHRTLRNWETRQPQSSDPRSEPLRSGACHPHASQVKHCHVSSRPPSSSKPLCPGNPYHPSPAKSTHKCRDRNRLQLPPPISNSSRVRKMGRRKRKKKRTITERREKRKRKISTITRNHPQKATLQYD